MDGRMNWGLDTLAGARYAKRVYKNVPKCWMVGFFWEEFGPSRKFLLGLCNKGYKFIRVQIFWGGSGHSYPKSLDTKALKITKEISEIQAKFPGTKIFVSPFCEHREKASRMEMLLSKMQSAAPNLTFVNSPISGGAYVKMPGVINEVHHNDTPGGSPGAGYIFSYDGLHCTDSDVEKMKAKHKNASFFLFWVLQFNRKQNRKDTLPPKARKLKPTGNQLKAVMYLANDKTVDTLNKKWQWKSDAEQHSNVDKRASKPVLLGPIKGDVYVKAGSKKIPLVYSGTEHGGDHVYRSLKLFGFQMAKKNRRVRVFVNGKSIGEIDPGFRSSKRFIEK